MSVAEVDQDFIDAGIQLIWVLEQSTAGVDGTAELCEDFMDEAGATAGWCVGDAQTQPDAGEFDDSPFANGRGIDIAMDRADMIIGFVADHGTPSGNDNLTGEELLADILGM